MPSVIESTGLTKSYGPRRGITDVTFAVDEGEVFGFLGPNGAGKTTTIRTLLGLLRPTAGHATIFGLDVWADAPRIHERLSYVGSDPAYLGELSAGQQLDYVARLRGLPKGAWKPVAERLELDPSVQIRKLSRGNRQKVGVVQAFMGDSRPLIMLDEPSSGLDPLMQREFLALLSEVRAAGRTVFLSSHNLPEVERSCDRVGNHPGGAPDRDLDHPGAAGRALALGQPGPRRAIAAGHLRASRISRSCLATARDVHLLVRGDVNPLLRLIAQLDVRDIAITTPEIEDIFLRFYDRDDPMNADDVEAEETSEMGR